MTMSDELDEADCMGTIYVTGAELEELRIFASMGPVSSAGGQFWMRVVVDPEQARIQQAAVEADIQARLAAEG